MCESPKLVLNRRKFLRSIMAATCMGLGQKILIPSRDFLAFGAVGTGRRVVFIHMAGGWSINCAPAADGTYIDRMQPIYPVSTLAIGSGNQFLHPALTRMHARYQAGQFLVLNKVRDTSPNYSRSHEDATVNYLSGLMNPSIAGTTDLGVGARIACIDSANSLAAISFAGSNTWASGNCNPALDIDNLDNLGEQPFRWSNNKHEHFAQTRDAVHAMASLSGKPREKFVRTAIDNVSSTLDAIENYQNVNTGVNFPGSGIGSSLRNIARIIIGQQNSPLRTAAFLTSQGGYDTHSNEVNSLNNLLGALDQALEAFIQSMELNGLLNDVAVVLFGEFGRTFSNGSGTDHGASQRVFFLGGRINGGRVANAPESPAELGGQYVTAYDFEFRSIFRQFVEGGLGIDGSSVFPDPLPFGNNPAYLFR